MAPHEEIDDCWNWSGVLADSTCERLREHLHCRNCPVYGDAARGIMQRPLPPQYRQEWARHFAQAEDEGVRASESAVVFRIGHEWLALPTHVFATVAEAAAVHRLPHRHEPGLLGVVNVGGKLYPCIALSELMSIDVQQPNVPSGRHAYPRLIVVQLGRHAVALPVHDVHGIEHYHTGDMLAPPSTVSRGVARYLSGVLGVGGKQAGCLDPGLLGQSIAELLR